MPSYVPLHVRSVYSLGRGTARLDPLVDSNDNFSDFAVLDTPTPGNVPVNAVPLPPALALFMSGIVGMCTMTRRRCISRA